MFTISLEEIKFHSPIGVFPEERKLGNDFLVDVHLQMEEGEQSITALSQTVDYTQAYELVKAEMGKEQKLLETTAQNIMEAFRHHWPQLSGAEIIIRKLHPPLQGEVGSSKISLSKKF